MFTLSDYNYNLPSQLIAQTAAFPPECCKFLVYNKAKQSIHDHIFSDISTLIDPKTLIVFNNTKVLKARLKFPQSSPQGISTKQKFLEIFYLHSINNSPFTFNALIKPGKKFKVGSTIPFNQAISFHVDALTEEGRQLTCSHPIDTVLTEYGQMPLPPYISYEKAKENDYQPVFASKKGSVAAPTASLHFTNELISTLISQGVKTAYTTLHVGLGTFKQVNTENIKNYNIHSEHIEVAIALFENIATHKSQGKPILAVGTTVTRTLESLPYIWKKFTHDDREFPSLSYDTKVFRNNISKNITLEQANKYIGNIQHKKTEAILTFSSKLFIYPGFTYYIIDELITNFHLPKSSLLMLVAGYMGYTPMKKVYEHAIKKQYRFYSFGDAMWIRK